MTSKERTEAQNEYYDLRTSIDYTLDRIEEVLARQDGEFERWPRDWGRVGDLVYVLEKLESILDFLG